MCSSFDLDGHLKWLSSAKKHVVCFCCNDSLNENKVHLVDSIVALPSSPQNCFAASLECGGCKLESFCCLFCIFKRKDWWTTSFINLTKKQGFFSTSGSLCAHYSSRKDLKQQHMSKFNSFFVSMSSPDVTSETSQDCGSKTYDIKESVASSSDDLPKSSTLEESSADNNTSLTSGNDNAKSHLKWKEIH